ncbi:HNH endonuclease [Promicromonospora sp. CA-289599]|uniref:HNH endonuclease n=1 Tax=Promicromonospora sp. CA-289599 TaxID=3240014 RepID=UPI003D8AF903
MGGSVDGSTGPTTVVEGFLRDALLPSPVDPALDAATAACTTLTWNAIRHDGEGNLPTATVTWPGHSLATKVRSTTNVTGTPGTPGTSATDGGPDDASSGAPAGLDHLPVGAGLVEVLAGIEVADLTDDVLLDAAARWQDLISWATAMQSRALGEIARRRSWTEEHNAAAAEISARLRVPQREANKHLARGAGLAEHPQVMNALHASLIDTAKADILLRSGNPLTHEERDEAITRYLPEAPDRTRGWLRNKMNEFAHQLNGTLKTTKHAMARRAVYLDPADNTMAWVSANLPAPDAAAVWDAIEQAAHTLRRAPGSTRTLTQARADALVAITTGRIIVPPHPECAQADGNDAATSAVTTTTTDTTTTPTTAEAATPEATAVTPEVAATAETAETAGTAGTALAAVSHEETLPRTTVAATGCTCGGCTCGGTTIRVIQVKPQIRVTIPATTLLGLDSAPGHLEGYGPIPADIAAQIATDATWQRLLTDPTTGILTDYSTTTYQPGKILRQAVTTRDQSCTFLQCERPAHWADLDHIQPFDHDLDPTNQPPGTPGQTRATNLQPLCRAHHLAKTHHGWTPVRDPTTGTTTWTAPTGHTYTRPPTQTGQVSNDITSLSDDTRARLGQPPLNQRPTTTEPTSDGSTTHGSNTDGSNTERSSVELPTTEQRLNRFPDEPPF